MRKLTLGLLIATLAFAGCGGDDDDEGTSPEPQQEETADDTEATPEEFILVNGEQTGIVESCVDTSGQYIGNLPEGGLFILRGGTAPEESFVDYLPSQDADPLSSQEAGDTVTTTEGDSSFITGTTTVTTEDGANSLEIEFGVVIEDVEQDC